MWSRRCSSTPGCSRLGRVAMVCGPEIMMRFVTRELDARGARPRRYLSFDGTKHEVCASVFADIASMDRISFARTGPSSATSRCGPFGRSMSSEVQAQSGAQPKIGIFKFASCDGCQLSLLDAEDELLGVAAAVEIAYFPEATRAMLKGPYDIGLVEGSITTHGDAETNPGSAEAVQDADHDRGLRNRRRHPGTAERDRGLPWGAFRAYRTCSVRKIRT